eukprot:1888150-Pyramimonas_sp.AAC.1
MDTLVVDWSGSGLPNIWRWQRRPPLILHPEYEDGEVPGQPLPESGLELGYYTSTPTIPSVPRVPPHPPNTLPLWAPHWLDLPEINP